ncbi:amino acid ABC transporter permease [Cohnella yongneupensis]|uniref:Amino acid ABC transporter permease n=1 Tax=Cohnella yongneupensis TaxID=425006 RepID=A0ABW0QYK8_9BACL
MSDFNFHIIQEYFSLFMRGTLYTIEISIGGIILGSLLGLIIAFGSMSHRWYLRLPTQGYIHLFRGTPLLLQIFIVHFGVVPQLLGHSDPIVAAVMALALNSAAYTAEIYRAGIQSIDKGQTEAALSLGMTRGQAMRSIILPQAIKRMIPAFGNEFIVLIKDSSLVAIIAAPELMYWVRSSAAQYGRVWEPYLFAALVYLVLTYSLSKVLKLVERKM